MPFSCLYRHTKLPGMLGNGKQARMWLQPAPLAGDVRLRPMPVQIYAFQAPPPASLGAPDPGVQIDHLSLHDLREAIRSNRVSFPAQVPIFLKHDRPDLQRKMVQLYFILGWSCGSIANRYGMLRQRVQQILNTWKHRAVQMGYIQDIPLPEEHCEPAAAVSAAPMRL